MADKNYYDILGVSKAATPDEIKKAYRKLALEHHPDRHGGDDKKFKEIGEAYEVLKDPQKRSNYDQFGSAGGPKPFGAGGPGGGGYNAQGFDFGGFDFSQFGNMGDIFDMFTGGGRGRGPVRGRDIEVELTLDFKEAVFGVEKKVSLTLDDVCDRCHGSTAEPGTKLKQCPTCKGSGQITRVQNTILGSIRQTAICDTCNGRGEVPETPCTKCRGRGIVRETKNLNIKVPAGVDNGTVIRLGGQGEAAPSAGASKGDLYAHIVVRSSAKFQREGADIVSEATISMTQAALGTEIKVATLEKDVTLKIPAGTQSGQVIKLRGYGVPRGGSRGDQLVRVNVEIPTKLSAEQKELLERFAAAPGKKRFWEK